MTGSSARQLGRTDRYVRRGLLSLAGNAPRLKLAFIAEESLRLCTLPGEEEGRVYYFRRLRVSGLPENGDRRAWLEGFQRAMAEQASNAVHGSDPRAERADAVYFRSEQEACEALLMLVAGRAVPSAWYWAQVSGVSDKQNASRQLMGLIQKLLATPASWSAVAAALLSMARQADVVALLRLLPDEAIVRWLSDLGVADPAPAAAVRFSEGVASVLTRAIAAFGADAPLVLWIAALAIITVQPSSVERRSAGRIARASLRALCQPVLDAPVLTPPQAGAQKGKMPETSPPAFSHAQGEAVANPVAEVTLPGTDALSSPASASLSESPIEAHSSVPSSLRDEVIFGEPTAGAGLYFLLNVLQRLEAEREHFTLLFLARLFRHIGSLAGIEERDPILRWAQIVEAQSETEELDERRLRLWVWKIRRSCWRAGRLRLVEVVRRSGYVTLTRTDLDVTMSIESADVRIRRIGLDLNPGWLPWFGRVVRFHYRYRGELCG